MIYAYVFCFSVDIRPLYQLRDMQFFSNMCVLYVLFLYKLYIRSFTVIKCNEYYVGENISAVSDGSFGKGQPIVRCACIVEEGAGQYNIIDYG